MPRYWLFLLIALLGSAGCKKYNLNQPAYLSFSWELANVQNGGSTVSGGYVYPSKISLTGDREEGADVSIEQTLPAIAATFSAESNFSVNIDAPMGKYKTMSLKMELDATQSVPVSLRGTATVQGTPVIFSIEWYEAIPLDFQAGEQFDFKKKESYDMKLVLDCAKLFEDVTQDRWDAAVVSSEPNGPTVKIREDVNHDLFEIIKGNIAEALELKAG
jgi:hypothetical protein